MENLKAFPRLESGRFLFDQIDAEHEDDYARLAGDVSRNALWGYDWREEFGDTAPVAACFADSARKDFSDRKELPFAVFSKETGKLIGEVVLHDFDSVPGECQLGIRVLPEYEGKGCAREAVPIVMEYAFRELRLDGIRIKAYAENERSVRLFESLGLKGIDTKDGFIVFHVERGGFMPGRKP